jgi:hypothetical protein
MSIARNTAYNLIGSAIPLAASLITVPIMRLARAWKTH